MYTTLIGVAAFQQAYHPDSWAVFDCRSYLTEPAKGRSLYEQGHIPGAMFMDMETDLSAPVGPTTGRHPLPDFTVLASKLANAGVSSRTQVLVYDDMAGAMAARLWWLLRYLGHEAVAVLDGGYPAWLAAGGEPTRVVPVPRSADFTPKAGGMPWLTTAQVQAALADYQLIDARTPERFAGENEPIDPVAGHIPGAVNRPLQTNLGADGCFLVSSELAIQWQALLAGKAQPLHMCGSGVTACHNILSMLHAGLAVAPLYAGSWSEWIRDPDRPIAP